MSEARTTSTKRAPQEQADLNPLQRQRVDQSFEKLFGYEWDRGLDELPEAKADESTTTTTEHHQILVEILGRRAASRLLRSHRHLANTKLVVHHRRRQVYKHHQASTSQLLRSQLPGPMSRGVTVTKTATVSEAPSIISGPQSTVEMKAAPVSTKKTPAAAVDNLLQQLTGPNKVSTVAKTHSDWDQFKEQTGLTETLEEQADSKTAFLKKQDFLQRVDHRTFEKEKQDRDRERAKRGN